MNRCPHDGELRLMEASGGFRDIFCSQCGAIVGFLPSPNGLAIWGNRSIGGEP
jgi:hypothetical protein